MLNRFDLNTALARAKLIQSRTPAENEPRPLSAAPAGENVMPVNTPSPYARQNTVGGCYIRRPHFFN